MAGVNEASRTRRTVLKQCAALVAMGGFPALGALAYLMFREVVSSYTATWQLWFGLLFMSFILFSPRGLMGLAARVLAHWRKV
ncbi:MAG: twin-arginine translocation signal domain-containing protein [Betaproteobacteria bacterium]|nr:twin-arginine translocation signal domain-containing protein [Betaproteobacteria bacterium]